MSPTQHAGPGTDHREMSQKPNSGTFDKITAQDLQSQVHECDGKMDKQFPTSELRLGGPWTGLLRQLGASGLDGREGGMSGFTAQVGRHSDNALVCRDHPVRYSGVVSAICDQKFRGENLFALYCYLP